MKRALFIAISTSLVIVLYITGLSMADDSIQLCHSPPGNPDNWHTITVSENQVEAHLAHGDLMGPCEDDDNCAILCDDGNPCTVDRCDATTGGCAAKLPVDCDDGRACTDDFCDMNVGCFNVENCVDGEECGHNTGECVGCPSELRYGMDAAVGAFARHRNALCYGIGTGHAEVTSTIVNTLYGWPEGFEILDARSRLDWPNDCSTILDPLPDLLCTYFGYASVIPVLGYELDEYEDKCPGDWRIRSPGGVIFILTNYANETLAYHPDEGVYHHIGDEMVRSIRFPIPEGGDPWYMCPEDVPPDIIDQQIVCAKKSAREISDIMAQPCEAISP